MSDTQDDGTSNPSARKPLSVPRPAGASGVVTQDFPRGRTNRVEVEIKRRRPGAPGAPAAPGTSAPTAAAPAARPASPAGGGGAPRPSAPSQGGQAAGQSGKPGESAVAAAARKLGLSEEEFRTRMRALEARKEAEAQRAVRAAADAEAQRRRDEEDARRTAAEVQHAAEQEVRRKADEAARLVAEEEERRRFAIANRKPGDAGPMLRNEPREVREAREAREAAAKAEAARRDAAARPDTGRSDAGRQDAGRADTGRADAPREADRADPGQREARPAPSVLEELGGRRKLALPQAVPAKPARPVKGEEKRRQGRLSITSALNDTESERQRSLASVKRAREKEKMRRIMGLDTREKVVREVVIPESITLQELANRMTEKVVDVVRFLMKQGQIVRAIDVIDADMAELIVSEFGHTVKRVADSDVEIGLDGPVDDEADLVLRPPVVTIMGHVDHGKTSLLDALRQTDVVSGEAGGITQHIGAYQVNLKSGERITFLDTPGHAAFSAMRARGASCTDIVVLVVAADDGVMPQTIEAISHARAAKVPIIVAINKMDKPDAKPSRVLDDLLRYDVVTEAVGGDVQAVEVSALKKIGLDKLTEAITLQSEVLELKANPGRAADGVVIEAKLDKGRGPVATLLVQRGSIKRGDTVVCGANWGRVRALVNERGQQVQEVGPSSPIEILGLDGVPSPGDQFTVVENEARAREVAAYRADVLREKHISLPSNRASLDQMLAKIRASSVKEASVIVKGDVQGSVEAISSAIEKLSNDEVRARVIFGGVGGVTESDVLLSKSTGAPIIAFNVRANAQARDLAEREGVEIRYYSIIYDLLDDIKGTLEGLLAPEKRETFIGYAQILQVFNITKVGKVAGCRVTDGVVRRGCGVRLIRDDVVIHEGKLSTLKRFKDEVPEVNGGTECGMAFEKYDDIREGDQIECFTVEIVKRKLA
jgi:translation initiation factor IF-2